MDMEQDFFIMVMEAGGNLAEPFDAGADMGMDAAATDAPPPMDDMSTGDPPPIADSGGFDSFDSSMGGDGGFGGDDFGMDGGTGGEQPQEGTQNGGEKLSEKANSLLNQKLYTQMMARNQEVEDIIENLNKITALLPYEVIKQNSETMNRLKDSLDKGKRYVIQNFIDAKYGENLIFFQKLDALYTLLIEQINTNLKQLQKNSNEQN